MDDPFTIVLEAGETAYRRWEKSPESRRMSFGEWIRSLEERGIVLVYPGEEPPRRPTRRQLGLFAPKKG